MGSRGWQRLPRPAAREPVRVGLEQREQVRVQRRKDPRLLLPPLRRPLRRLLAAAARAAGGGHDVDQGLVDMGHTVILTENESSDSSISV
jgi:hypothetical protein